MAGWFADAWSGLVDLVLPSACGGCDAAAARGGLCTACATAFAGAAPARVRPQPAPPGLPRCMALAAYDGALRAALLAYKERGRHPLAGPLGDRLADVVAAGVPRSGGALRLVPVPATAAAARARHGDHLARLARRAARRLRGLGYAGTVVQPLRALPRPDSAELSSADRARAARQAFALRPGRLRHLGRAPVVLLDDVITTGATLSAAADLLRAAGIDVVMAAVLAATQRHTATSRSQGVCRVPDGQRKTTRSGYSVPANEG